MSNRAIFFDRDDTLIEDPGFINNPDQVKLLDGVTEALIELKAMDYKLIVVSNQSGVARGIITEKVLGQIHKRLKQLLAEKGAYLDQIYYCPYHPEAVVPKYRKESNDRKPNPGMLLTAANEMDIDLSRSWVIGDSSRDVEAGLRAGCKTILINNPLYKKKYELGKPNPDYKAVNIKEAVNIIKKHHRCPAENPVQTQSSSRRKTRPALQTAKQPNQPESTQAQSNPIQTNISGDSTELLLSRILEQLKTMQRIDMFGEFHLMRLMAGIVQFIVLGCLLISIYFLMSPTRQDNSLLIALGFAIVLQLMALTFYIMQGRK